MIYLEKLLMHLKSNSERLEENIFRSLLCLKAVSRILFLNSMTFITKLDSTSSMSAERVETTCFFFLHVKQKTVLKINFVSFQLYEI